jgi:hypothetical protein
MEILVQASSLETSVSLSGLCTIAVVIPLVRTGLSAPVAALHPS